MTVKKLVAGLLLFSAHTFVLAQNVELKDDKVLLDGKPILKFERANAGEYSFYDLLTDDEILLYKLNDNETREYYNDDFMVLKFLTLKKKVETHDFSHVTAINPKKVMQKLILWLLKEKVLDADGKLNSDKFDVFHEKYDENITERTLR